MYPALRKYGAVRPHGKNSPISADLRRLPLDTAAGCNVLYRWNAPLRITP
jgi:hypothetical protein